MESVYDPAHIEADWYQRWERQGLFRPRDAGEPYCIMIPPPNVTGTLHMGHAFQDTIMDALVRYHRMDGRNTLWQPGTDHAGIATQMVVERQLEAEGSDRHEVGRERFVERVWDWKERSGGTITRQLRRMGASVDWEHERFTMDDGLSAAVRETFVRLYDEGLIYRGKRLVNWDPVLGTAISDLEVVSEEEDGHLWHIRYPLSDGSGHLVVATTRPETMLGDTAVAVHPEDPRYADLIGREVELPLCGRAIPVIADDYVDPEFGTGCLKITPAHDFNDYAVGERHRLAVINVLTADARIADHAPAAYRGLDRFAARERVVADLQAAGLLDHVEPHRMKVPRGDRSRSVVEPYLTDQWFVRTESLASAAIEAVESGRIRFVPEQWNKTYFEWMRNIQDWCISRQLWWGHRIPAWYDAEGQVYVGRDENHVRQRHHLDAATELTQDEDVLDTWYSSALWPFSTLGWPDDDRRLQTFYPTTVLVTGFDIIFFWVARMVMMGLKFMGEVPFAEVYIHGLVRDADGNKMSKSKGNILDPIDLIDGIDLEALVTKRTTGLMQPRLAPRIEADTRRQFPQGIPSYGTDALRFTFCSLATQGRDIRFDLGRIGGYRNFCNKLWNATRYVAMNSTAERDAGGDAACGLPERWIVARLQQTIGSVREAMAGYRLDLAAQALYEFVWNEYCDWYLELAKPTLLGKDVDAALQRGTRRTLVDVLETTLRLIHPLMPFISEELWQRVAPLAGRDGASIMTQPYPQVDSALSDQAVIAEMDWVKRFVLAVRRIRGELDLPPSRAIPVEVAGARDGDRERIEAHRRWLHALAGIEHIQCIDGDHRSAEAAVALAGDLELRVPLAGVIDKEAERARLEREIARRDKDLARVSGKLGNPDFVARAPAPVVERERGRLRDLELELGRLREQVAALARL